MNKTRLLAIVSVAVIGTGMGFFALSAIRTRITAEYWREQLAAAPDEGVEIVFVRIAELDTAGISILVAALGSERECVAQAAKQELFARLEQWRRLSVREYAARLTGLAEALAEQVEHFSPAGQRDAADVAERMLDRPLKGRGVDTRKLLAASETVLRAGLKAKGEFSRVKAAELVRPAVLATDDTINAAELPLSGSTESSGQKLAGLTPPSEGGSSGKSNSPPTQPSEDESQTADSAANRPWLLGRQESSRQRASRIPDNAETTDTGRGIAKGDSPIFADHRDHASHGAPTVPAKIGTVPDSGRVRSASNVVAEATDRRLSASLAAEGAVELIRGLNSENESGAAAAEAELIRRGFTKVQLDLARMLFDPDPAVRKRLVQELPGLQGVEAVPWLMELCRDAEAEVRLAAITFLATSSDPAVLDEIEQMAGGDTDSNIRRVADRIGQQRNVRR